MSNTTYGDIAFYVNRGGFEVDRSIDFHPKELEKDWVDLDHVLAESEFDLEAYRNLCRTAIGITTRILFLPEQHCPVRAIGVGGSFKPTGGFVRFTGRNFAGDLSMGDLDFAEHGLRYCGNESEVFELGNHASVDGHINIDGRYYSASMGLNACLVDRGSQARTQVASPEFVQEWTEKILKPLEYDIKSGAYVWTGSPKTDLNNPQRVVYSL